jgi:hypothetical protein
MRVPAKLSLLFAVTCLAAASAFSDEIRLKDGKKLYGIIVAFEDNMFKVKTDYGFVLIEKDKIASIVPTTPSSATPSPATAAAATPSTTSASKPAAATKPAKSPEAKPAPESDQSAATNASTVDTSTFATAKPKISSDPVRPAVPSSAGNLRVTAPAINPAAAPRNPVVATTSAPAPPKEPEPANREEVQGNLYTNFSHGFRMYKAPSWELIEDARKALPNAIVAMGTSNESTLMVVGQEPLKDSLDACANAVEKRLREIYSNYRFISRRKIIVGGAPAVEFKYRGMADEHDWSGTLVVVLRDKNVLTMLGMTYADNDLIQIQENVISRAISSTDFNVH